jgi:hypothetical protein
VNNIVYIGNRFVRTTTEPTSEPAGTISMPASLASTISLFSLISISLTTYVNVFTTLSIVSLLARSAILLNFIIIVASYTICHSVLGNNNDILVIDESSFHKGRLWSKYLDKVSGSVFFAP